MYKKLIDIKRAIKGSVYFDHYVDEEMWYRTDANELFPVPFDDLKGATFLAKDKGILFMRWMRLWNKSLETDAFN